MSSEVERVTKDLNEAERRAVLYLSQDWTGPAYWQVANTIRKLSLIDRPLAESRPHPSRSQDYGPVKQWRLTPLGLAVRGYLKGQDNDHLPEPKGDGNGRA